MSKKRQVKDLQSTPREFNPGEDGIITASYDFRLLKSDLLNDAYQFLKQEYTSVYLNVNQNDSLCFLTKKSIKVHKSIHSNITLFLLPCNSSETPNYWPLFEELNSIIFSKDTLSKDKGPIEGYEFLHLRTMQKVWVYKNVIHFVC